jgi:hypothetical protein
VGRSGGVYSEGEGEREDVGRALEYLFKMGKSELHVAGYSFGAWVNATALGTLRSVSVSVMVSPPVAFMDFEDAGFDERIGLVVAGSDDDLAPAAMLREACGRWNPRARLEIISGADHFYCGKLPELGKVLEEFLVSSDQ